MSLQGVLSDFGVAEVFQLIAQQRKTGILAVERRNRKLEIHFSNGSVLRAQPAESRHDGALATFLLRTGILSESDLAEAWRQQEDTLEALPQILLSQKLVTKQDLEEVSRLVTDETIFELFLWDEGKFSFSPGAVEQNEGDRLVGAEMVLLDALRMRDEWAQVEGELLDLSVVLTPMVDIVGFRAQLASLQVGLDIHPERLEGLFNLCDGRQSARRVIDLSRLGTFEGARGLVALLRADLLSLASLSDGGDSNLSTPARDIQPGLGYAVLAISIAWAAYLLNYQAPILTSHPLPSSSVHDVRADASVELLRNLLETFHWTYGNYPESLGDLREIAPELLAEGIQDGYSYSRSPEGYSLERVLP